MFDKPKACINIDFVIPVKCNNFMIRSVIEGIQLFYKPRFIYVISNIHEIEKIKINYKSWLCEIKNIIFYSEETFFEKKYGLSRERIEKYYTCIDEKSREFGWWYQQLLKLGSLYQIEGISDPYIVWDSDLVSIKKWEIYPSDLSLENFKFAVLQENAKNEWNRDEYARSAWELLGLNAVEPEDGGTFVPHHFVFHHEVIHKFLDHITNDDKSCNWITRIMELSQKFYRFSEYKCIATFMINYFPHLFSYHPFEKYGKQGIRYRDWKEIVPFIKSQINIDESGLSFKDFCDFVNKNFVDYPSYIQIEHIY